MLCLINKFWLVSFTVKTAIVPEFGNASAYNCRTAQVYSWTGEIRFMNLIQHETVLNIFSNFLAMSYGADSKILLQPNILWPLKNLNYKNCKTFSVTQTGQINEFFTYVDKIWWYFFCLYSGLFQRKGFMGFFWTFSWHWRCRNRIGGVKDTSKCPSISPSFLVWVHYCWSFEHSFDSHNTWWIVNVKDRN